MARKKNPGLTDAELRLMEVVWETGSATVSEVVERLSKDSAPLAYSTVLTILRILENKGHLRHTKEGRAFIYHATAGREQARSHAVTLLLKRFFEGSPELLMLNLIENKKIDPAELKKLRKRIEEQK